MENNIDKECYYVDVHTHFAHHRFDDGRNRLLDSLKEENIMMIIEAAIDVDSNEQMLKLCDEYFHVFMVAGCHPNCVEELDEQKFQRIVELVNDGHGVVGIGETGLDYSRDKTPEKIALQKKWFIRFIELSLEVKKPLVIHCREAYDDLIEILSRYKFDEEPGMIHCFSGTREQLEKLLDMGFYISVGGMFTRCADEQDELLVALRQIPLDRILLETDAPFLLPAGLPGKRNTSLNIKYIASELAKLRNMDVKELCDHALDNAIWLFFNISKKMKGTELEKYILSRMDEVEESDEAD